MFVVCVCAHALYGTLAEVVAAVSRVLSCPMIMCLTLSLSQTMHQNNHRLWFYAVKEKVDIFKQLKTEERKWCHFSFKTFLFFVSVNGYRDKAVR